MSGTYRWKLKGCPRCQGDMVVYNDYEQGIAESCLQCGCIIYLDAENAGEIQTPQREPATTAK